MWTEGHLGPSVNGKSFTLLSKDCCDQLLATQVLPGTHKMFFFDWYLCGIGKILSVQGCGFSILFAQLHNKSCSGVTSINGVYRGRFLWALFKMEHPRGLTSMSNLLVAITCPTHVSHKELNLKKPSPELEVQKSPTIKISSVLPFQVESSNPLFGCSELDLQSLSMIPCSIG